MGRKYGSQIPECCCFSIPEVLVWACGYRSPNEHGDVLSSAIGVFSENDLLIRMYVGIENKIAFVVVTASLYCTISRLPS